LAKSGDFKLPIDMIHDPEEMRKTYDLAYALSSAHDLSGGLATEHAMRIPNGQADKC
jgi:hypothetical protein